VIFNQPTLLELTCCPANPHAPYTQHLRDEVLGHMKPVSLGAIAYFGECDRSFRRIVTGGLSDVLSAVSVT